MKTMDDVSIRCSAVVALRQYFAQKEKKSEPEIKARLIVVPKHNYIMEETNDINP